MASSGWSSIRQDMSDVFLSHSEQDADLIALVQFSIERLGLDVHVEEERGNYGEEVVGLVQEAIEDCECFLVILTEESITSPWVNQEIGYACALEKTMLPVWVGNVRVHMSGMIAGKKGVKSKSEDGDFPEMMDRIQRFLIDFFDIDSFIVQCEECGNVEEWDLPDDDDMFRFTQKDEPMVCECDGCGHDNNVDPLTLFVFSGTEDDDK